MYSHNPLTRLSPNGNSLFYAEKCYLFSSLFLKNIPWNYIINAHKLSTEYYIFSNVKIYNNRLITFPSSIENANDYGVEYVYVENGVYDRGRKKNNLNEARRVADLVFEHFRKYPNRSLGVVTFSEAQQDAVDMAIRQKRLQEPKFDSFFIEDKEEAFFIKNLENVQGDERDTIIFSIGYAKDSNGIMHMNFGPLSKEGGYRRLNVAITRAKYNVKLVGSIASTDIDLDRVNSEGVKMLRSYIEFAQQGVVALENEISFPYNLEFDSPFEEAVYNFLQSKGYNVVTQVGCSGFRIDMAVKHPIFSGKFVIGIECDGATYHSSRTARERDRLRQTVLEDMGWTIYRIWSTDWIKDTCSEKEKLVKAIENALNSSFDKNNFINDNNRSVDEIESFIEVEEQVDIIENTSEGYGFETYSKYQLDNNSMNRRRSDVLLDVISKEQPLHFEELCRRVLPLFERQKVTSVVRNEVLKILNFELKKKVEKDENDFVTLNGFNEIKVRVPIPNDDYIRSIEYICDRELSYAMKTIIQHSVGITPENLFSVTARQFGVKRVGDNIVSILHRVYEQMLENDEILEIEGKVRLC